MGGPGTLKSGYFQGPDRIATSIRRRSSVTAAIFASGTLHTRPPPYDSDGDATFEKVRFGILVRRARRRLGEYVDSAYGREGLGERVGVYGPVERCAEQLREVVAAGATELVLSLVADPLGQLEAAAAAASVTWPQLDRDR